MPRPDVRLSPNATTRGRSTRRDGCAAAAAARANRSGDTTISLSVCHGAQALEDEVCGQQRGNLTRPVVQRRHLDDVAADEREVAQSADELQRLVAGQPADLRRAGARRE